MDARDKEREKMANIVNLHRVFTVIPTATIEKSDRFLLSGLDFRVALARPWPVINPRFYEIFLEQDD